MSNDLLKRANQIQEMAQKYVDEHRPVSESEARIFANSVIGDEWEFAIRQDVNRAIRYEVHILKHNGDRT